MGTYTMAYCKATDTHDWQDLVPEKEKNFWNKVDKAGECWEWTGGFSGNGYGSFKIKKLPINVSVGSHLFSYILHNGRVAEGRVVMHSCDNKKCVNPDHLSLGSHADNVADKVAKKRHARGETNGRAKITLDDANDIRDRFKNETITKRALASEYGIDESTVRLILLGRIWNN